MLLDIDLLTASPSEILHEQVASWWAAMQVSAMVAVGGASPTRDEYRVEARTIAVDDARRDEIAAALGISATAAQDRLDASRLLAGPLRHTHAALACGELTPAHVRIVVEAATRLPGAAIAMHRAPEHDTPAQRQERREFVAACTALQELVLPVARRGLLSDTRRAARRALLRIDADGQRRRRAAARCTRDVRVVGEPDGLSTLIARMDTVSAHAVLAAVNAVAHDPQFVTDCEATMGERRAEALAAAVLGTAPSVQARLDVVIDLPALMSLQESRAGGSGHVATLVGSGPIAVEELRDLLSAPGTSVGLRRLVSDPVTGGLLDCGRRRYEATDALRAFVMARDATCRFPAAGGVPPAVNSTTPPRGRTAVARTPPIWARYASGTISSRRSGAGRSG